MFFKLAGGIIIISAAGLMGFLMAGIYVERVRQLRELQYCLNILESEIVHSSTPLVQAFKLVSEKSSKAVSRLFKVMAELLFEKKTDTVAEAFDLAFQALKRDLYLEREEIDIISSFMQSIGSSDIEGQKKNFNVTVKKLEAFEKKAEEIRVKNEKLYRYLGICGGALIVILLV
ncbi:stage III sporulation protein SpoIIIAB [Fonticella tunisiensis]|uniref:Stage III sporulation protein AB n=1 Tax=Fonticella tunisiensis TaxID=1096341 RepID=A0A4R7KRH5_9CLOT|nr:stage III sporulation protein SpoIIIAB [Fonticella tunisiensis]TDT61953.1 stage III sporulation protein AB [Fonticella tunisiensis]